MTKKVMAGTEIESKEIIENSNDVAIVFSRGSEDEIGAALYAGDEADDITYAIARGLIYMFINNHEKVMEAYMKSIGEDVPDWAGETAGNA